MLHAGLNVVSDAGIGFDGTRVVESIFPVDTMQSVKETQVRSQDWDGSFNLPSHGGNILDDGCNLVYHRSLRSAIPALMKTICYLPFLSEVV